MLVHDTGEGENDGHPGLASAAMAMRGGRRLGLDGTASHTLRLVIEHHLLMANVSQRRDTDDLSVVRNFAKQIQTPETLALLTLHTFADAQATSHDLWNGFKDSTLWSLYHKALKVMAGGTEFVRAEETQRELLLEEVGRLMPKQLADDELRAHFASLPPRYFQIHSAKGILDDLLLAHRFLRLQVLEEDGLLAPVVNWHNEPDRGYNEVKVCTWDRPGLFSKITGSLSAAGLTILTAQIFTRADGIVVDTFCVTDAKTGSLAGAEQRDKCAELLGKALTGADLNLSALIGRQTVTRPNYQP